MSDGKSSNISNINITQNSKKPGNTDNTGNDDNADNTKKKQLDIGGFFKAFGRYTIYLIIVVLLSTSFRILLTHYDPNASPKHIFPGMDIDDVPYSQKSPFIKEGGKLPSGLSGFFERFFPMNKWSFPYKNTYSQETQPGILGNVILWLTESIAFSNQLIRRLIGIVIESLAEYKDNNYGFWIFGLLILFSAPFIPLVGLIAGVIGPFMAIERIWVGWRVFLLMCLPFLIPALLYCFSILATTSIIAHIQSLYTIIMALVFFVVFPYSLQNSHVMFKETLSRHRYGILRALLFGVVINAFRYLNKGFGYGSLGLFILTIFGLV